MAEAKGNENLMGAASYLLGFITGIIMLLLEKQSKFVRFHAMQSTILFGGVFIINMILGFIRRLKHPAVGLESAVAAAYLIGYAFSCAGDNLPDYLAFNWYVWFFIGILIQSAPPAVRFHEKSLGHHSVV